MLRLSVVVLALVATAFGTTIFDSPRKSNDAVCVPDACPAGYTGYGCEFVLCDTKGSVTPPDRTLIDLVPLKTCASTIAVLVDSHVQVLILYADGTDSTAQPSIVLKDGLGNVIPSTETTQKDGKTLGLGWSAPARGRFYATISAQTSCLFQAFAQTNFTVSAGFTYGARAINNDSPVAVLNEFQIATMVMSLNNLPAPGSAYLTEVFSQDAIVAGYDIKTRYGCAYSLYAGPVVCDSTQNWYFKLHGIDNNGFSFMRTNEFRCVAGGSPVTTTTAAPVTTTTPTPACYNGGVQDPSNGQCVCSFGYIGSKCQTPNCQNGGYPTADGSSCTCPTGYGDRFCFEPICTKKNPTPPANALQKTIGFVIQTTTSMSTVIQGLIDYAPELIETLNQQHPQFVMNYVVVSFDDKGAKVQTTAHDPLIVISHIQSLFLTNGTVGCLKQTNKALALALKNVPVFSSTYVWTDSPVDLSDAILSLNVLGSLQSTKNRVSVFYTPQPACQALTTPEVQRLFDITEFTGGQIYYTASQKVGFQLAHVPTTAYLTGRAFDRADPRCDIQRVAYVPIDSHTAGFSISVSGFHPSVVVRQPNGALFPMVPIVDDALVQVSQALSPCPDGWVQNDGFCFKGFVTPSSWDEAQIACRLEGATLANILNAPRQAVLDGLVGTYQLNYWTGLHDLVYSGLYEWDSISVPAIPLLASSYRNFAPGQPSDPNNKLSCIAVEYVNNKQAWFARDCNEKKDYICQKPALDIYFNNLPSGLWKVEYQTRNGSDWGTSCLAKVDVQSTLQANFGFTTDANSKFNDIPSSEPSGASSTNRVIASFYDLHADTRVSQVQLFKSGDLTLLASANMNHRQSCAYEYYSDVFTCPANAFGLEFSGHDEKGYLFTRQGYGICLGTSSEQSIDGVFPHKF
jgi:hypothetical protein